MLREKTGAVFQVDELVKKAHALKASDVHLEPMDSRLKVRLRLDGLLEEQAEYPLAEGAAILSRLKILAGLDIGEKRIGQDGRFDYQASGESLDIRVSTLPTIEGEKIVLRLLGRAYKFRGLVHLGLEMEQFEAYQRCLKKRRGLVIVTGPTGSGKTTTLYASLGLLSQPQLNIVTIEDPVEYRLDGINQISVNPKAGLTFTTGLRSVMRQDPDVILVGEIRDAETAQIAVRAALTGHLVLTTLHTADALSAVHRLLEMGVEPYLLAPCLNAVLAQRLVRVLCQDCRRPEGTRIEETAFSSPLKADRARTCLAGRAAYASAGCSVCRQSGFKGRDGIFEIIDFDDKMKEMVLKKSSLSEMRQAACRRSWPDLWENGLKKVAAGRTTLVELGRVLGI